MPVVKVVKLGYFNYKFSDLIRNKSVSEHSLLS